MVKGEFDFETWFDSLAAMVLDKRGVEFRDEESVRDDYEAGKNCADVADDIAAEYDDGDD
ncbi:MAG TPA: hypothetical protein GXX56_06620 [Rhodocyclaceae bacterium]|nr:hypothetical protein [Rhodocyclaceae bacterium]